MKKASQGGVASKDEGTRPRSGISSRLAAFASASRPKMPASALESLRESLPADRLFGWVVTSTISAVAFLLRLVGISYPPQMIHDEWYYVTESWSLKAYGYETAWEGPEWMIRDQIDLGDASAASATPFLTDHPLVGKWLISLGESAFGLNAFGWRFMAALFGALLVFMVIRLARRLSRSTLIGALAGVLLTVDGLSFVMSRLAMLDIFQAFFIVAAVACVVADRDYFRHRLADAIEALPEPTLAGAPGPFIFRPWLIGAGLLFGLAIATKWNSIFPLAVFGVVTVVWSLAARRVAGAGRGMWMGLLKDGVPAFVSMVVVAGVTYLLTWMRWAYTLVNLRSEAIDGGIEETWISGHANSVWGLISYWHTAVFDYHTDVMVADHPGLISSAWTWPFLGNAIVCKPPREIPAGIEGCTANDGEMCLETFTFLGTPLLWWLVLLGLLIALVWWLAGRDWRFGVPILGYAATWIPWLVSNRWEVYLFYAVTMIPFGVIALAMVFGVFIGEYRDRAVLATDQIKPTGRGFGYRSRKPTNQGSGHPRRKPTGKGSGSRKPTGKGSGHPSRKSAPTPALASTQVRNGPIPRRTALLEGRSRAGVVIVGAAVTLIIVNFIFIHPILTAGMLTPAQYDLRIWLPGWR